MLPPPLRRSPSPPPPRRPRRVARRLPLVLFCVFTFIFFTRYFKRCFPQAQEGHCQEVAQEEVGCQGEEFNFEWGGFDLFHFSPRSLRRRNPPEARRPPSKSLLRGDLMVKREESATLFPIVFVQSKIGVFQHHSHAERCYARQ